MRADTRSSSGRRAAASSIVPGPGRSLGQEAEAGEPFALVEGRVCRVEGGPELVVGLCWAVAGEQCGAVGQAGQAEGVVESPSVGLDLGVREQIQGLAASVR